MTELEPTPDALSAQPPATPLAQVVGNICECATPAAQGRLLEQLLNPLGALSLVRVADGIFANLRFRSGWQKLEVRAEDLHQVRATDVVALIDHVQQVSLETLHALARLLTTAPGLASSDGADWLTSWVRQYAPSLRASDTADPSA